MENYKIFYSDYANGYKIMFRDMFAMADFLGYYYAEEFVNTVIYAERLIDIDDDYGTYNFADDDATLKWFKQFGLVSPHIIASGEIEAGLTADIISQLV